MRYVGSLLASALTDERAKIKSLLDKKISQLKAGGMQSKVMSIAPPPALLREADDSQSIEAMLDERDFQEEEGVQESKKLELVSELEGESQLVRALRGGSWRSVRPQIFAASAVLVIVAVYFAFLAPSSASSTNAVTDPLTSQSTVAAGSLSSATSSPTAVPSEVVLPPQQMIEVQIQVVPANAIVTVDDAPLKGPPYSVRFPKEKATHVARAAANGYVTKTQQFTGDRDVLLDLSLARAQANYVPPPPPPHVFPHVTQPPPQPTTQPEPPATHVVTPPPPSTVRPIDTSSPYSQ
jgi:hypothetical protein